MNTRYFRLDWVLPVFTPVLATCVGLVIDHLMPSADLSLIYLAAVLVTAMQTHVKPALMCALICFLAYSFFFTEPHYSLMMFHSRDVLTVALLVLTALITGHLAAGLNEKVSALRLSNRWNHQQIALARDLALCVNDEQVVKELSDHLWSCFRLKSRRRDSDALPSAHYRPQYGDEIGTTLHLEENRAQVQFIRDRKVEICIDMALSQFQRQELRHYLEGFTQLAGLAWRRTLAENELRGKTVEKEREQLRNTLIAYVSKDLDVPLASISGSLSTLIDSGSSVSEAHCQQLLNRALQGTRRLKSSVGQLADMLHLGQGELKIERDEVSADAIISAVLKRFRDNENPEPVQVHIDADLPVLHVHAALIAQVLLNLLENAFMHTPSGTEVSLSASESEKYIYFDVSDSGPGMSQGSWEQVMEMFTGEAGVDAEHDGVGLAICQRIAAAHAGYCEVLSSSDEGTAMRLVLPKKQNVRFA